MNTTPFRAREDGHGPNRRRRMNVDSGERGSARPGVRHRDGTASDTTNLNGHTYLRAGEISPASINCFAARPYDPWSVQARPVLTRCWNNTRIPSSSNSPDSNAMM